MEFWTSSGVRKLLFYELFTISEQISVAACPGSVQTDCNRIHSGGGVCFLEQ